MIHRYLDPLALLLTRNLQRIFPTAPVLHEWPSLRRIVVGTHLVVFRAVYAKVVIRWALIWRKKLSNTIFVGVTGSAGKTTAKDMLAAILSAQGSCCKTHGNQNESAQIARFITSVKRSNRFCVAEIALGAPGKIAQATMIVQPQIGVITTIGTDHYRAFGSKDAIAREKSLVIAALPANGIAVLNADDPLVMEMKKLHTGQIITYGVAYTATLRAEKIAARWPEWLSFDVIFQGQSYPVQTLLYGRYWVTSVLAALATGLAVGVPLKTAIEAIATVPSTLGRMNSMTDNRGVTFIRDDLKAPLWSLPLVFDFMREARAKRKIIILGTIADSMGDDGRQYVRTAEQALEVADHVCFVGPNASHALKVKRAMPDKSIRAFPTVKDAADYMAEFLQKEDLVLLKSSTVDHLGRIFLARITQVKCWRGDCHNNYLCDDCRQLSKEVSPSFSVKPLRDQKWPLGVDSKRNIQIIVGLGNPGKKFDHTPHNAGFQTIDRVADNLGVSWVEEDEVMLGHIENREHHLYLVKPRVSINKSGAVLARLCERLGCGPEQCVLLFDDVALPLGKVRLRMHGSDGGHRGVRSILMTFQSEKIRRVKIGVGTSDRGKATINYLLSPFLPELRPTMEIAYSEAAEQVIKLVGVQVNS